MFRACNAYLETIIGTNRMPLRVSLEFAGIVPSGQKDNQQTGAKQTIRRDFSIQIAHLWQTDPMLHAALQHSGGYFADAQLQDKKVANISPWEAFWRVPTCGYLASAIVTRQNGLLCELDVELWRREAPGAILHSGGQTPDLDNRLKTLFDALRIPLCDSDVPGNMWGSGQEELDCLLEDDGLISKLTIDTKKWSRPPAANENPDAVKIIVNAHIYRFRPESSTETLA